MNDWTFQRRQQVPREWRRRVMIPARMRIGAQWSDACILNVSSRGVLIHGVGVGGGEAELGTLILLRRGDHSIEARVAWQRGRRAGLQSDEILPVTDIMGLSQAPAPADPLARRKVDAGPGSAGRDYRLRARLIEFATVVAIAVSLAASVSAIAGHAITRPMAAFHAALGG